MPHRPMSATTALVATLSLLLPQAVLVPTAQAQERIRLCRDLETTPPCPEGEPRRGAPFIRGEDGTLEPAPRRNGGNREDAAAEDGSQDEPVAEESGDGDTAAEALEEREPEAEAEAQAEAQAARQVRRAEREAEEQAQAEAEAQAEAQAARQARRAEREAEIEARARADVEAELAAEAEAARQVRQARRAEREAQARAEAEAEAGAEARRQARQARRAEREAQAQAEAEAEARAEAAVNDAAAEVEEEVEIVDVDDVRSSDEDFTRREREREFAEESNDEANNDDDGLSDLEKALLVGLGAVAVGSLLDNGTEVVSNSGDRVVTRNPDGFYTVYRDDDALLRQEGSTVRTQTFNDGSTRTIVERSNGDQVVTIRSAEGRVLRRARVLPDGTQVVLLDDTEQAEPVDVRTLVEQAPPPVIVSGDDADEATLRRILEGEAVYEPGRTFTLRQVREISAVRNLVPGIDLDAITFATGSAAIPAAQVGSLVDMGLLIEEALDNDPSEIFLIEGHTDAVGSEASNLALSDRRAETVALALTENFAIPPENLVVQGYGEDFLKIPTESAEPLNRRATIRRITPLLQVRS